MPLQCQQKQTPLSDSDHIATTWYDRISQEPTSNVNEITVPITTQIREKMARSRTTTIHCTSAALLATKQRQMVVSQRFRLAVASIHFPHQTKNDINKLPAHFCCTEGVSLSITSDETSNHTYSSVRSSLHQELEG